MSEERVIITRSMIGICGMQVCAVSDATDEEILNVANTRNPSGTKNGWSVVLRTKEQIEEFNLEENCLPVECDDNSSRTHFLILC